MLFWCTPPGRAKAHPYNDLARILGPGRIGGSARQIPPASQSGHYVYRTMPEDCGYQTSVRQAAGSQDQTHNECHHNATPALVAVSQTKQKRRDEDHQPGSQTGVHKGSHGKSAIEEFFAKAGSDGESQVGQQLNWGLGEDALGDGLQRAAGLDGDAADAAQVEPLQTAYHRCADDAGN